MKLVCQRNTDAYLSNTYDTRDRDRDSPEEILVLSHYKNAWCVKVSDIRNGTNTHVCFK